MEKINFQDNVTRANALTMNTFQDNVENAVNNVENAVNNVENAVNNVENAVNLRDNYIKVTTNINSQVSSNFKVLLNQIDIIKGNKLSLNSNNNSIVIGEGVNHIMVSGSIFLDGNFAREGYCWGIIEKNGANNASALSWITNNASFHSSTIPLSIINVSAGDQITLVADSTSGGTIRVGSQNTWLMVKVID